MSVSTQWSNTFKITHFKNLIWIKFLVCLCGHNPYHSHTAHSREVVCVALEPTAHPCIVHS